MVTHFIYLCMCVFSPNGQFLVTLGKHLLCSIKAPCGSGHGWTGAAVSEDHVESSPAHGVMCTLHAAKAQQPCVTQCVCIRPLW